ncbi:hypothetical protein THAOC_31722 [Thalassiosira oceanica]|uniref:Uncharacterized protein n=1 Tax=Thalassiosira oceanica TaxID=159749 RepID=K0R8N0_THAOC|nr:hypothetical protein THAOC_31722 [Thalassiosira oceanica]|eukprot:EJK49405.1 hypothetical protein THAOC_31722 [Thalassiosira oceanica]
MDSREFFAAWYAEIMQLSQTNRLTYAIEPDIEMGPRFQLDLDEPVQENLASINDLGQILPPFSERPKVGIAFTNLVEHEPLCMAGSWSHSLT